jgi:DNA-binding beta-propeller fold protein YncE
LGYVTNNAGNTVSVINLVTGTVTQIITQLTDII